MRLRKRAPRKSKGIISHVENRPLVSTKKTASFIDALASLRKSLWRQRILSKTEKQSVQPAALIDVVAAAA